MADCNEIDYTYQGLKNWGIAMKYITRTKDYRIGGLQWNELHEPRIKELGDCNEINYTNQGLKNWGIAMKYITRTHEPRIK